MTKSIPGINIQWPWSELIVNGHKTVETRSYDIPEKHRGVELAIIETPGTRGKKEAGIDQARIIGTVVFEKTYQYSSQKHWASDESRHRVPVNDPQYRFSSEKPKWAWVVKRVTKFNKPKSAPVKRGIIFATQCKV